MRPLSSSSAALQVSLTIYTRKLCRWSEMRVDEAWDKGRWAWPGGRLGPLDTCALLSLLNIALLGTESPSCYWRPGPSGKRPQYHGVRCTHWYWQVGQLLYGEEVGKGTDEISIKTNLWFVCRCLHSLYRYFLKIVLHPWTVKNRKYRNLRHDDTFPRLLYNFYLLVET